MSPWLPTLLLCLYHLSFTGLTGNPHLKSLKYLLQLCNLAPLAPCTFDISKVQLWYFATFYNQGLYTIHLFVHLSVPPTFKIHYLTF